MVESPTAESIEYRPPTQSQNPNMFSVSIPNSATPSALVETATKCLAIAASSPPRPARAHSRAVRALVIVSRVVNVFEQTTNSVSAGSRSRVASAKSVPSTLETKRKLISRGRVVTQRLIGHHRSQVRAADTDVDHVADPLAAGPSPVAAADPLAEGGHAVEHLVDVGDHVGAVDDQRASARHPQRDVEHGPVLGDVDPLAPEHRLSALGQPALGGERREQAESLVGDPVLRQVEVEARRLGDQPLAAARVVGEQVAQVASGELRVVALEAAPGVALAQRADAGLPVHRAPDPIPDAVRAGSRGRPI